MKSINKYELAKRIREAAGEPGRPAFATANLFFYEMSSEEDRTVGFVLGEKEEKRAANSLEVAQLIKNKQMGSLKRAVITILGPDEYDEPKILERIELL